MENEVHFEDLRFKFNFYHRLAKSQAPLLIENSLLKLTTNVKLLTSTRTYDHAGAWLIVPTSGPAFANADVMPSASLWQSLLFSILFLNV